MRILLLFVFITTFLFSCKRKADYVNDNGMKMKTVYEDSIISITRVPMSKNDSIMLCYIFLAKRSLLLNSYSIAEFKDSISNQQPGEALYLTAPQKGTYKTFNGIPPNIRSCRHSPLFAFSYVHPIDPVKEKDNLGVWSNLKFVVNGDTINKVMIDKIICR